MTPDRPDVPTRSRRRAVALIAAAATLGLVVPAAPVALALDRRAESPPSSTDPGAAPPTTDPPPTEPPATEPPATEPPVDTEPPVSEPPVTEPPETTEQPGTTDPQATTTSTTTTTTTTSTVPGMTTTTTTTTSTPPDGPSTSAPGSTSTTTSTTSTTSTTTTTLPVDVFGPLPDWNTAWRGGGWRSSGHVPGATWPVLGRAPGVPAVVGTGGSGIGVGIGGDPDPEATGDGAPAIDGTTDPDAGDPDAGESVGELPIDVDVVLATIREVGSGDNYLYVSADGRSGAYLYSTDGWGGYAGYEEARLAPAAVQDARARADAQRLLGDAGDDVSAFASQWFLASVETTEWWEQYTPDHNLSIGFYTEMWTAAYAAAMNPASAEDTAGAAASAPEEDPPATGGGDVGPIVVAGPTLTSIDPAAATRTDQRGAPPLLPTHGSGAMRSIAFPVLGPVDYYDSWNECRDECERRHEGIDIIGVRMQPLLAAVDGTITAIGPRGSEISGAGITILAADGWHYNYFHVNNDNPGSDDGATDPVWRTPPGLGVGDRVRAGQVIGYMGDSGNSEGSVPHLHFEMRDPAGLPHSPFWSLQAAERRQACSIGLGPWSNPMPIGQPGADVAYTTVTPLWGDGAWYIDSQGRVTAVGDAALINPSRGLGCLAGPSIPYGTGAAGWNTS